MAVNGRPSLQDSSQQQRPLGVGVSLGCYCLVGLRSRGVTSLPRSSRPSHNRRVSPGHILSQFRVWLGTLHQLILESPRVFDVCGFLPLPGVRLTKLTVVVLSSDDVKSSRQCLQRIVVGGTCSCLSRYRHDESHCNIPGLENLR